MAKTKYLEYGIYLTDRVAVTALQVTYPNGIRVAPATAAVTYAAPLQEFLTPFSAPCVRSPWFWSGVDENYPRDQDSFTRKIGGWFGLPFLFGTNTLHIWVGLFELAPESTGSIDGVPTEVVAIATRRWVDGFELPQFGEGGSGTAKQAVSKDASRHPDGFGFAFRGDTGAITHASAEFGAISTVSHWDRFYVRIRKAPTAAARLWIALGGNQGVELQLTVGLALAISNVVSGASVLLTTTSVALVLNEWTRVDIVLSYATGAGGAGAYVKVYFNGVSVGVVSAFPALGLGTVGGHVDSRLGSAAAADYEADFDDWIGSAEPNKETAAPFRYVGVDWLNGSKVQRLRATAFGAGHDAVNWTNQNYSLLNQLAEAPSNGMVSTTAAAAIVVETDAAAKIDAQANALGIVALVVGVYHNAVGLGQASVGFMLPGEPLDLLVQASDSGADWDHHLYHPGGETVALTPVAPLTLHYLKDNDATSDTVYQLNACAEVLGIFGAEDVAPGAVVPSTIPPRSLGAHNNPYPESPWARLLTAAGPYVIHSGTIVETGAGQDIFFRVPVHWFYFRRVLSTTDDPVLWMAANLGGHTTSLDAAPINVPVQALIDPAFVGAGAEDDQEQRTIVRIGAGLAAATYQYVAVCDPAGRFLLTGGLAHGGADAPNTDALPNADFAPEAGFFQWEDYAGGGGVPAGYYKGPGHAANATSILTGAEVAEFLSWSAGALAPLDASTVGARVTVGYGLWRRDDGSGDAGIPKVVQIGSYIGDGTASRTVTFGPTLVRPLWVMVVPHNAAAIVRDPGHLTTKSCPWNGTENTATGITAGGIDSFSVGSVLNANGIVYDWFVLPGGVTACNGGFSCDGEFLPVDPETPEELCDDPEATNFGELGVCVFDGEVPETTCTDPLATNYGGLLPCVYDTGPPPPGECVDGVTESTCITETTNLVNLALFEIGVSEMLTNYCTQLTREAVIARTVFNATVRTVLHAYPWPFATKYAVLVLATNQPTHADWTYAYRVPEDCVFPRRLVVSRGTAKDPEPPAFMLSSEAGGGLLFTNQASAVLEYTCRPTCVAVLGDALFIETLKWKLGAVLAPPLTRMDAPAARCQAEYVKCLELANAIKKPGVPGVRTALPLVGDESAACSAANVQVVNRGLLRIGCPTIANLSTDQSPPAVLANLILEDEIRATLRDYPWKFAKRYNAALTVVAGTSTVAANPDWQYTYRLPTDYVMVRRLVAEGTGRKFEDSPPPWEVGTDVTGDLLMTAVVDPNLEYTARIPCVVEKGDDLFRDALAWRIAAALAPSLAQVDPAQPEQVGRGPDAPPDPRQRISHKPNQAQMRAQATQFAHAMYRTVLRRAQIQDANEAEPEDPPDAEWIRARG